MSGASDKGYQVVDMIGDEETGGNIEWRATLGEGADGEGDAMKRDASTLFVRRASSIHTYMRPVPPDHSTAARLVAARSPQTVAGSAAAALGSPNAMQPITPPSRADNGGDGPGAAAAELGGRTGTRRRSAASS